MTALVAVYDRVLKGLGVFGGLVFGAMAVLVSLDVVLRNLGLVSFPWLLEVSEYALYVTTFLVAPWVLHLGAHVRVDVLFNFLGPTSARMVSFLADLIGLGASAVLGWYGARIAWAAYVRNEFVFKQLVIPEWWLLIVIPVSCTLLTVEFARRLLRGSAPGPKPADRAPSDGL